jgi:hypothetical protein
MFSQIAMLIIPVDFAITGCFVRACTSEIFLMRVCTGRNIKNVAKSVHYQYKP